MINRNVPEKAASFAGLKFSRGRGISGCRAVWFAALIVLLGIGISGCGSVNEDARLVISDTMSPRLSGILKDLQSHVSAAYSAKERKHLTRLAGIFESINECFDELQGKNKKPAPTAQDWGDISEKEYQEIQKLLAGLENKAELCIDYCRDMHYNHLESGWKAFLSEYSELRKMIDKFGSQESSI